MSGLHITPPRSSRVLTGGVANGLASFIPIQRRFSSLTSQGQRRWLTEAVPITRQTVSVLPFRVLASGAESRSATAGEKVCVPAERSWQHEDAFGSVHGDKAANSAQRTRQRRVCRFDPGGNTIAGVASGLARNPFRVRRLPATQDRAVVFQSHGPLHPWDCERPPIHSRTFQILSHPSLQAHGASRSVPTLRFPMWSEGVPKCRRSSPRTRFGT